MPTKNRGKGAREGRKLSKGELRQLEAIIRADIRDLFDTDGKLKRLQDLPAELRLALERVEVDATGRMTMAKLKDRVDAMEAFLRHHGRAEEPEVVALLKAARAQVRRAEAIYNAVRSNEPPSGQLN